MSATTPTANVAIIGAGLGGLGLALSLHHHRVSDEITLYEQSASPNLVSPGAVMLSPNCLSILDRLGVYGRIRGKGFNFESSEIRDDTGRRVTGRYWFGSEKWFGYKALRIYRGVFVREMLAVVEERGIQVVFGKKFDSILKEDEQRVEFKFVDGETKRATLLVAADGIHSKVREYVSPTSEPVYGGLVAVVGAVKREKMVVPAGERIEGPIMFPGRAGQFIIAPQDVDGSELMAGTQRRHPAQDREGWERFTHDRDGLKEFLHTDLDGWPDMARSAIEGIDMDTVYTWPQFSVPRLDHWTSEGRRVILVADAAHAIPPTLGQGANQAFEDGFTLALLLSKVSEKIGYSDVLAFWQDMRRDRVDKLIEMTVKMNNARLPKAEQEKLGRDEIWRDETGGEGDASQMEWLFMPRWEQEITAWENQQMESR